MHIFFNPTLSSTVYSELISFVSVAHSTLPHFLLDDNIFDLFSTLQTEISQSYQIYLLHSASACNV